MKQKLAGVLFLLAMPCSIFLYVKAEEWSGSEIVGLLAAISLYVAVALVLAMIFNPKKSLEKPEEKNSSKD